MMEVNRQRLDPLRIEKAKEYQSKVTGATIEDAVKELQKHSWDLQLAISSRSDPKSGNDALSRDAKQMSLEEKGQVHRMTSFFARTVSSMASNCIKYVGAIVRYAVMAITSVLGIFSFEDPTKLNRKFIEDFEYVYGHVHPEFSKYRYSVSLHIAMREQRVVLVFVRDPSSEEADNISRGVICTEELANYVKTYNIIFYMCDTRSPEYEVILRNSPFERAPPLMFIRAPNPATTGMKFHFISEFSLEGITRSIDAAVESSTLALKMEWGRRKHNESSRRIREEREAAYKLSLENDALKEIKLKEKLDRKTERELSNCQKIKERETWRKKLTKSLLEEPTLEQARDLQLKDSIIRLKITFPSDERIERRFWKHQTIGDLYDFVETQDLTPLTPLDNFYISSIYPPKSFFDRSETLENTCLFPAGNVIIEEDLDENHPYNSSSSE